MTRDEIVQRISECQTVLDQLENSPVWNIVATDCKRWIEFIDSKWQECSEEQLDKLRTSKFAYMHLLNIENRYKDELDAATKSLNEITNADVAIPKDYDNEGIKEQVEGVGNYGTE